MTISPAEASRRFAALGDPTRLALLGRLGDRPRSIAQLSAGGAITRQAVTRHLRVLESAGLVEHASVGRESRYARRDEGLAAARADLAAIAAQWDAALDRLRAHVETG